MRHRGATERSGEDLTSPPVSFFNQEVAIVRYGKVYRLLDGKLVYVGEVDAHHPRLGSCLLNYYDVRRRSAWAATWKALLGFMAEEQAVWVESVCIRGKRFGEFEAALSRLNDVPLTVEGGQEVDVALVDAWFQSIEGSGESEWSIDLRVQVRCEGQHVPW